MDGLSGLGELAFNYIPQQGLYPKANVRMCGLASVDACGGQGSGLGPLGGPDFGSKVTCGL